MSEPKAERRRTPGWNLINNIVHGLYVIIVIAMIIFACEYDGILRALHNYQQPACQVK